MKLLPTISFKSDIYQLGLIILELMFGRRMWIRGDKAFLNKIADIKEESLCNKETTHFLFEKVEAMLRAKPEERINLK